MKRKLGRSNIEVSAMGMGCWAIGGVWSVNGHPTGWGEVDDNESISSLHAAWDQGITLYDTAANYGTGHSETILARAFSDRRDKVIYATKFGYNINPATREVTSYGDEETGDVISHLRDDLEASLRRLNTDYVDLYQFHVNGYDIGKAAEVRDLLETLSKEGKIRFYGWSTDNFEGVKVFAEGEHCTSVQANLNVVHHHPEMLALCKKLNLACLNRGPLGMGMLTGKYTKDSTWGKDDVRTADWFKEEFLERISEALPKIQDILISDGRTLAQGALAWLWAASETTIPIPGIRTVKQAEENAGAMRFGPLKAEQMAEIEILLGREIIA